MAEPKTLVFVALDDIHSSDTKKQVRSFAAQHSHQVGPRRPKKYKKRKLRIEQPTATGSIETLQSSTTRPPDDQQVHILDHAGSHVNVSRDDIRRWLAHTPHKLTHPLMNAASVDPFETYPVPSEPWFPEVLDYSMIFSHKTTSTRVTTRY